MIRNFEAAKSIIHNPRIAKSIKISKVEEIFYTPMAELLRSLSNAELLTINAKLYCRDVEIIDKLITEI
jgi:hypothetical protein